MPGGGVLSGSPMTTIRSRPAIGIAGEAIVGFDKPADFDRPLPRLRQIRTGCK